MILICVDFDLSIEDYWISHLTKFIQQHFTKIFNHHTKKQFYADWFIEKLNFECKIFDSSCDKALIFDESILKNLLISWIIYVFLLILADDLLVEAPPR